MLQRTQILLDKETKTELEKLALLVNTSMSNLARDILKDGVKKRKKRIKKPNQVKALLKWAEGAVKGPGGTDYDKYIYEDDYEKDPQ